MIGFEFDPAKSAANLEKHGIDFAAAQDLWAVWGLEQATPFNTEVRFQRTAQREGRIWTAVFTLRGPRIRLISVRTARKNEVADYERSVPEDARADLEP